VSDISGTGSMVRLAPFLGSAKKEELITIRAYDS
jgi:hypothetical protein